MRKSTFIIKKAKIMLMAITVLATTGGVLAFKAQKMGVNKYCILETNLQPGPQECTTPITQASMTRIGIPIIYYEPTQTATPEACALLETCELSARGILN